MYMKEPELRQIEAGAAPDSKPSQRKLKSEQQPPDLDPMVQIRRECFNTRKTLKLAKIINMDL